LLSKSFVCINGATPLWLAAQNGKADIVRLCAENGADVHNANSAKVTPVQIAAEKGYEDVLAVLIDYHARFASKRHGDVSNLHVAIRNGHTSCVNLLLSKGFDVNYVDVKGETPLIAAVSTQNEEIINVVLSFQPDVNLQSKSGETAIGIAILNANEEIYFALRDAPKFNLNQLTPEGQSLLHLAAASGSAAIVNDLLTSGLDPVAVDAEGNTVLHTAVQKKAGHDVLEILLRQGCDPNATNKRQRNVFSYSTQSQAQVICELIDGDPEVMSSIQERRVQAQRDAEDRLRERREQHGQKSLKTSTQETGKSRHTADQARTASVLAQMTKNGGRVRAKPGDGPTRTDEVRPWGGSSENELLRRDIRKKVYGMRQDIMNQLTELEQSVCELRDRVFEKYGGPEPAKTVADGSQEEVVEAKEASESEVVDGEAD
jgi:ankyrin repeat protein